MGAVRAQDQVLLFALATTELTFHQANSDNPNVAQMPSEYCLHRKTRQIFIRQSNMLGDIRDAPTCMDGTA